MKNYLIIVLFTLFSCFGQQPINDQSVANERPLDQDSLVYMGDDYEMIVYTEGKTINQFKLCHLRSQVELNGGTELILVNGEIPEGSLREDHNNPDDYRGYECGSTYQYIDERINIAFALEKSTNKRLDLQIYNSDYMSFEDGDYTLVLQNK